MLKRAFDAGVPAAWVAGDSVYGDNWALRMWREEHHHAHGLAVSGKASGWQAGRPHQGNSLGAPLGAEGWSRCSAGDGTKGPRWDAWRWRPLATPLQPPWRRGLVVRRSRHAPTALTAYVGFAPPATGLETVGQVAGRRWTVARCCAEAHGEVGLDQYAGRNGTGW